MRRLLAGDFDHPRMAREYKTIMLMIRMYCRDHHAPKRNLCEDCAELLEYARMRLGKCPFQGGKTTCLNCPVHCYKPAMRDKVSEVMRYSGPKMLRHHPVLAVRHLIDGRRKEPVEKAKKGKKG